MRKFHEKLVFFVNKTNVQDFIWQFVKFGLVGISNTIISLAIYYVLILLGLHYLVANTIAFVISVLNAYYWSRKFVFVSKNANSGKQIVKVYISYGFTFLLATGLMFLQVDVLEVSTWIAPLVNLCVTVPLNFFLNKFWAFK